MPDCCLFFYFYSQLAAYHTLCDYHTIEQFINIGDLKDLIRMMVMIMIQTTGDAMK